MWKFNNKKQYQINKQYFKDKSMRWKKQNPEREKEIWRKAFKKFIGEIGSKKRKEWNKKVINTYYKSKIKWISRSNTRRIISVFNIKLDNICKICKNKTMDLEIHHEIYPTKRKDILKAIQDKHIYYLCKCCHEKLHSKPL